VELPFFLRRQHHFPLFPLPLYSSPTNDGSFFHQQGTDFFPPPLFVDPPLLTRLGLSCHRYPFFEYPLFLTGRNTPFPSPLSPFWQRNLPLWSVPQTAFSPPPRECLSSQWSFPLFSFFFWVGASFFLVDNYFFLPPTIPSLFPLRVLWPPTEKKTISCPHSIFFRSFFIRVLLLVIKSFFPFLTGVAPLFNGLSPFFSFSVDTLCRFQVHNFFFSDLNITTFPLPSQGTDYFFCLRGKGPRSPLFPPDIFIFTPFFCFFVDRGPFFLPYRPIPGFFLSFFFFHRERGSFPPIPPAAWQYFFSPQEVKRVFFFCTRDPQSPFFRFLTHRKPPL